MVNDSFVNAIFLYQASYSFLQHVHVNITGISAYAGILIWSSNYTSMMNVSSNHNKKWGILFNKNNKNITMRGISVSYNGEDGLVVQDSNFTTAYDVVARHNNRSGIYFLNGQSNTVIGATVTNNDKGLVVTGSRFIRINKVFAHDNRVGIVADTYQTISLADLQVNDNTKYGLFGISGSNTVIQNVHAQGNGNSGIAVESLGLTADNITAIENNWTGIEITNSSNIIMTNIVTGNNKFRGVYIMMSNYTTLSNISVTYNNVFIQQCSNISFTNISINYLTLNGLYLFQCTDVLLEESTFSEFKSSISDPSLTKANWPAIISVYNTRIVEIKNCNFINNAISSIAAAAASIIRVEEYILFENISAVSGAAFVLSQNSKILVSERSNVVFRNNSANQYGTAFYIVTEEVPDTSILLKNLIYESPSEFMTSQTECFVKVEGKRSNTQRFIFINNTAMEGGDVVYGGIVAAGYDGYWNCLLSFKNISDMTHQSSDMEYRRITSAPSRVCLCHDTSYPDCLIVVDPTPHTLYPGETLSVSATVVGQDFGTVSGDIYVQFMGKDKGNHFIRPYQKKGYKNGQCQLLNYTLFSECEKCKTVIVLTTDKNNISHLMNVNDNQRLNQSWYILHSAPDYNKLASHFIKEFIYYTIDGDHDTPHLTQKYFSVVNKTIDNFYTLTPENYAEKQKVNNKLRFPQQIYTYPLYIDIEFRSCPLGFTLSDSRCDCNHILQCIPTVKCDIKDQTIIRSGSVWVGADDNETVSASQYCPLTYCKNESVRVTLHEYNNTDPNSQCNYKHSGILCGSCQAGLSLALGSENCLHCSNAYIILILPFAIAGILLVLFIKVLDFTVCHGTINGLFFYANVINANKQLYYSQKAINPITMFISWFNLDLGIETCFYDGLNAYTRTWLQFLFPIYIWCIAGTIIFLANYSKRWQCYLVTMESQYLLHCFFSHMPNSSIPSYQLYHTLFCIQHKVRGLCGQLMEILTILVLNMLHFL